MPDLYMYHMVLRVMMMNYIALTSTFLEPYSYMQFNIYKKLNLGIISIALT